MESDPGVHHHRDLAITAHDGVHAIECWPDRADANVEPAGTPPGCRPCLWCHDPIRIVARPGRPRLYCRRSCRQRAYERRSGLGVLPPVERRLTSAAGGPRPTRGRPNAYEAGLSPTGHRRHAMRPTGRPDAAGRWATLCGLQCRPTGRPFAPVDPQACRTCVDVQHRRPPGEPFAPSPRLAVLRAVLEDAGTWMDRRQRWMRGTGRDVVGQPAPGSFGDVLTTHELVRLLVEAAA